MTRDIHSNRLGELLDASADNGRTHSEHKGAVTAADGG
jgi:hypothetical protein